MRRKMLKESIQKSFWLSLFLHLLLLLSFSTVILWAPKQEKNPNLFVPAYTYTGKVASLTQPRTIKATNTPTPQKATAQQENAPTSKNGLQPRSLFAASQNYLRENQFQAIRQSTTNSEPIYLIGDGTDAPDPIIKLLAKALSAHFKYPELPGRLGIKGKVYIGLTLHPEGYLSNIQMVRSSNNPELDAAALYAVNTAPEIAGLKRFLPEPKHFVIGFVFR